MSIRERNKGYQIDISHNHKRYRLSIHGDKLDATVLEQQIKKELKLGKSWDQVMQLIDLNNKNYTVSAIFNKVKTTYNSLNAVKKAQSVVNDLGPDLKVTDLNEDYIEKCIDQWRTNGNTNATINRKQAVISKICSYAYKKGYIKSKPEITWKKEGSGNYRYMQEHEQVAMCNILRGAGHTDMEDLINVACDTGFRYSELKRINLNRDLHGDSLTCVATKNDTIRTIPLTKRTIAILKRRGNFPFANITDEYKRDAWDYGRVKLGLENDKQFTFHCTRHTCASRLVQGNMSIQVVQEWLGHKTIKMTLRYAHLNNKNLVRGRDVLENISCDNNSDNNVLSM